MQETGRMFVALGGQVAVDLADKHAGIVLGDLVHILERYGAK